MYKVLVVDDAMFMRAMLKDILTKGGYEVVGEASNGNEAVSMYKELQPDIVTLDITMPVMTGLDALKAIREFDPDAKCIMCSAMGQQNMVIEAIQNGAKDFIVKPFQSERVMVALSNALAQSNSDFSEPLLDNSPYYKKLKEF